MSFNSWFGYGLGAGVFMNNYIKKSYNRYYKEELEKARAKLREESKNKI